MKLAARHCPAQSSWKARVILGKEKQFGFGGIAVGAAGIAKVLFVLFLIGAVIALVLGRPWA